MRERVVTISSAGKTFSVTGWKIGWVCAPPPLIASVRSVKQFLTYVNGGPFQRPLADALRAARRLLRRLAAGQLRAQRDLLCAGSRRVRVST